MKKHSTALTVAKILQNTHLVILSNFSVVKNSSELPL
jgi:hypothetical protein